MSFYIRLSFLYFCFLFFLNFLFVSLSSIKLLYFSYITYHPSRKSLYFHAFVLSFKSFCFFFLVVVQLLWSRRKTSVCLLSFYKNLVMKFICKDLFIEHIVENLSATFVLYEIKALISHSLSLLSIWPEERNVISLSSSQRLEMEKVYFWEDQDKEREKALSLTQLLIESWVGLPVGSIHSFSLSVFL